MILSRIYYRLRYGIKIYHNILTEDERLSLLADSHKHLKDLGDGFPGLQSKSDLHLLLNKKNQKSIRKIMNIMGLKQIFKCWVNYTDNDSQGGCWHTHPVEITSVYYLENPQKLGTVFKTKRKEFQIDLPTNSLIVFCPQLCHSGPGDAIQPRTTLVIE